MQCESCSGKMKCRFTLPVGQRLRFRVYRCPYCESFMETVELPASLYRNQESVEEIVKRIDDGKRKQMLFTSIAAKRKG